MGCTSSAPNMVAANPNATDKLSEFSEDDTSQSIKEDDDIISAEENGKNEIKVLPSCDTLVDPIQLDSNNKSILDTSNLDLEKGFHSDSNVYESVNENIAKEVEVAEEINTEEKMSSLEDVVDKVVELLIAETPSVPETVEQPAKAENDSLVKEKEESDEAPAEETLEPTKEAKYLDLHNLNLKEEILEEAISPSQSTSSRATRWEALADIAAELPPSLTVDPVTGQIYALSK